jgi:hypothetical protein
MIIDPNLFVFSYLLFKMPFPLNRINRILLLISCLILETTSYAVLPNTTLGNPLFAPFYVPSVDADGKTIQTEAFGPFFEKRYNPQTQEYAGTLRPFMCGFTNEKDHTAEYHFLYPLYNRRYTEHTCQWDILGVIRGGDSDRNAHSFMIFPFFFYKKIGDNPPSACGIFPLAGKIDGVLWYNQIEWSAWPLYFRLQKGEESRIGMPWPFIQWSEGPECSGWAFWPFVGAFKKEGEYYHRWGFWPLVYDYQDDLYKAIPRHRWGFLPFYCGETWEGGQSMTWIWPFFGTTHQTLPHEYHEQRIFWPLLVQGRGEVDYVNRWAPLYTYSNHEGHQKQWIMWPLIKTQKWQEEGLDITRGQFLYVLIWSERQRPINNPNGPMAEKTHVWPLYSHWNNGSGIEQLQILSPLAVFFPHNPTVNFVYNPLFALYRYSRDDKGNTRHSLLFNLFIYEEQPDSKRVAIGPIEWQDQPEESHFEILSGLFGFHSKNGKKTLELLWVKNNLPGG